MSTVGSIVVQAFDGLFKGAILSVLKAIVPAMSVSTNLFTTGAYSAWESVLFVSEALVSLAIVLMAYSLFTGIPIRGRGNTRMLSRLGVAVVLMPFTLYFAQLLLDVNDAMTAYVLPYSQLSAYTSMVVQKLGGYSIGALIMVGLVTLLLYLVLIVRTLLVFFTAALLPLLLLCEVFEATRSFSRKILSLFLEMAFLPFFMAVGFRIGIATSYSTFSSLQVPSLIIAGTYLLPLLVPFIISPPGGRILQYIGLPAVGTAISAAGVATMGMASYAAGFISSPVRSLAGRGISSARKSAGASGGRGRLSGAARNFSAGRRHGQMAGEGIAGTASRLRSMAPSPRLRLAGRGRGNRLGKPHKIYVGGIRHE